MSRQSTRKGVHGVETDGSVCAQRTPFSRSMKISHAICGVLILAGAVTCLPCSTCEGQVAVATEQPGDGSSQSQQVVHLTWKASASTDVTYNVYRSDKKNECLKNKSHRCQKINSSPVSSTEYIDNTAMAGKNYYYVAKALNSTGRESGPSNEASVVISPRKQ